MITLSFGFKKPQAPDKGPVVFPAMEDNIQKLNDHTHDGSNSSKITTASIESTKQTILAAAWVSLGGGNYRQLINLAPGFDFDTCVMSFRDPSGSYIHPSVERVSDTTAYIYTNDNTINMDIYYGV